MDKQENLGRDEINFVEFSMSLLSDRSDERRTSFVVQDEIPDGRGGMIPRRLKVSGHDDGLPTPFDDYVLIALIHLTRIKNGFKSPEVAYTRYEILSVLGWNDSGRSYKRLDQSLTRWTSVLLCYDQAWLDHKSDDLRSEKFHVIESVSVRKDRYTFVWNGVVFRTLSSGYLKTLDLGVFFSLKTPVARKLYRFLNVHLTEQSPKLHMDLETLAYCKIGMTRAGDLAQIRRRLKMGIAELEEIGYISPLDDAARFIRIKKGECSIVFELAQPKQEMHPAATLLISQGVSIEKAIELAAVHSEGEIRTQIDALPHRLREKKDVNSPTGYLVRSIQQAWEPPLSYIKEQQTKTQKSLFETQQDDERRQKAAARKVNQQVADYWESLTPELQADLEATALANADEEARRTCDDPVIGKMTKTIIRNDYIKSILQRSRIGAGGVDV